MKPPRGDIGRLVTGGARGCAVFTVSLSNVRPYMRSGQDETEKIVELQSERCAIG